MKRLRVSTMLLFFWVAVPLAAQDPSSVWNAVSQPAFDPEKSAQITNLTLVRDRIHITLTDGAIQFTRPAAGVVFGAAFQGHGRLQVSAPDPREGQQLQLLLKRDGVDLEFTDATFSFNDGTFEEVARQVQWAASPQAHLGDLYQSRQREREDLAAQIVPRVFQGVLSADRQRTAYFAADLKTKDKGWVMVRFDALEPEEVNVGRWTESEGFKGYETWLSFPAGNRSASDAFRDPLAKEDFLIRGYQIDARVTSGAELSATSRVRLEFRAGGDRVLLFNLDANLRLDSVKDAQGAALPFFQPREPKDRFPTYGDYVAVVLPQPPQAGQEQTLEFHYGGKHVIRNVGTGNYFCPSYGWYPGRPNSFASRADFQMTFRTPKKLTLVATGSKTGETSDGKETVTTWKSDIPLAVAGFAFGDYKLNSQKVGTVDLDVYANRDPDEFLSTVQMYLHPNAPGSEAPQVMPTGDLNPAATIKTMTTEFGNSLRVFQDYFGPFPYSHLAVTNIPYSYGQGWPGLLYISVLSFLDSTQRHALGVQDQVGISDFFRAHETSHQWWGHQVGWKSYHDQWMSEGFAQFSGNLYVQFRDSPHEYLNRVRKDKEELLSKNRFGHVYESLGPVWMGDRLASSQAPGGYAVVIYNKGGYILHMLRRMLFDPRDPNVDQNFKAMMRDFCKTFANQPASTEDFKAIVEKHMLSSMDVGKNHKMDWFFNEYVYGTGVPTYTFSYDARMIEGKFQVNGTIEQSGVPDGWQDILPVYVHTKGRDVLLGWVRTTGKQTPLQFSLPVAVDKVTLNDNEDILAEIKTKP
jgi:hypothetical protein